MTLAIPFTKTMWRPAVALAGVTAAFLVTSVEAETAGPQPPFQMPVPCGQTWDASTYKEHWNGDQDAIDLAQRDRNNANISEGEPALAAAAGVVDEVYTSSNGEHRVFLDHGGGWKTAYVHLESLPPLKVGQQIAQGEMVGRISNSGAESMHLHYQHHRDDTLARISFNGVPIDTYAGNKNSWGTWGSGDAEELTSMNCAGNSFVPFTMNAARYALIYKPGSTEGPGGPAKIVRLGFDGKGVTTTFSGYLGQRLTHLVPFTAGIQAHFFDYKASTGDVRFFRFNLKGEGMTLLSSGKWWKGWTHFTPLTLGGKPYFLAYDSLHGYANVDRISVDGSGSTKIYGDTWTKGWTLFVPYVMGPKQYVLLYKGGTGEAKVVEVSPSGDTVTVTTVWTGMFSSGWTQLVPLEHKGTVRLLGYRATTGEVSYGKLRSNGQGSEPLGSATWNGIWTVFTPFLQDGSGVVMIYRADTGTVETRKLNDAGTGSSSLWIGSWTTGWS
jgi:Peptidase family M23